MDLAKREEGGNSNRKNKIKLKEELHGNISFAGFGKEISDRAFLTWRDNKTGEISVQGMLLIAAGFAEGILRL